MLPDQWGNMTSLSSLWVTSFSQCRKFVSLTTFFTLGTWITTSSTEVSLRRGLASHPWNACKNLVFCGTFFLVQYVHLFLSFIRSINNNNLSGSLPSELSSMTRLTWLYETSHFTPSFSSSNISTGLCASITLRGPCPSNGEVFFLCKFCEGSLFLSLHFSFLGTLRVCASDLSFNQLSGPFPASQWTLASLKQLYSSASFSILNAPWPLIIIFVGIWHQISWIAPQSTTPLEPLIIQCFWKSAVRLSFSLIVPRKLIRRLFPRTFLPRYYPLQLFARKHNRIFSEYHLWARIQQCKWCCLLPTNHAVEILGFIHDPSVPS